MKPSGSLRSTPKRRLVSSLWLPNTTSISGRSDAT
jgi:hypothetical protein